MCRRYGGPHIAGPTRLPMRHASCWLVHRSPLAVGSRTLSLHTLLDFSITDEGSHDAVQPPGVAKASSAAKNFDSPRKKPTTSTWARKQEVIDGVNDLIEELKDIDSSIANQVSSCWPGVSLIPEATVKRAHAHIIPLKSRLPFCRPWSTFTPTR